jgi:23S rRNA pseudouridine1911/1915/1917 synthase
MLHFPSKIVFYLRSKLVESFQLEVDTNGVRLDRWLAKQIPDLSRSRLQQLIAESHVRVNNRVCTCKKNTLQAGDRIQVTVPPSQPVELQPANIPLDILYEDDAIIIVNKPAGLVVHPAPGHEQDTLVNALLAHCDFLAGIAGEQRPGIVHRLDKDTSGALVVAKTDRALQNLQSQIQAKTAQRDYLGIVHGNFTEKQGTFVFPVGRHPVHRKKMAVVPYERGGREAITEWQVLERLGNYTLLRFHLKTGRTHQIRVHCSHVGHPMVGDPVYSRKKPVGVNLTGQALHAWVLKLQHPETGEPIEAIAPPPESFTKLLNTLRSRHIKTK